MLGRRKSLDTQETIDLRITFMTDKKKRKKQISKSDLK